MIRRRTLWLIFALAGLAASGEARAQADCLTAAEARSLVAERKAMPPARALRTARNSFPGYDVLQALLCRENNGYVYIVTVLSRDGRVLRTTIDATSGRTYR